MLEPAAIARIDPGGMRDIIASLPEQLAAGVEAGREVKVPIGEAQRIFIVGMGGSAIGGDVFSAWLSDRAKAAIQVVRDYRLPSYARPEDLLVAVSYSGNTEETLAAAAEGVKLGCRGVAITSDGKLKDLARPAGLRVIPLPTGLPPRGAFGHMFGILAGLGQEWTIGDLGAELDQATVHLKSLRKEFGPERTTSKNRAKALAIRVQRTVPVIYGAGPFLSIAKRWQTQLNENAKVLAFSSAFPEADHNELVGWVEDPRNRAHRPILLRDRDERPDLRRQLDITVSLISRKTKVEQIEDEGPTLLSRMLGTLFLGDYVSLYLAALRRVDPLVLKPIQALKAKLAEGHRNG
ncbi:MAG TPA: bifunctional phosphoglucose/phosphomannose isomerase [Thermoplasmata archaeon]|nr:bifunctional phosphoglucose/phosphomannose isomerase [Thermoplasmata archaeon]